MVIEEGETVVDMDRIFSHDVVIYQCDSVINIINMGSMVEGYTIYMDKHITI